MRIIDKVIIIVTIVDHKEDDFCIIKRVDFLVKIVKVIKDSAHMHLQPDGPKLREVLNYASNSMLVIDSVAKGIVRYCI